MPDILFILLLALVIFGPKKLPEIARQMAKLLAQYRSLRDDLKQQLESELFKIDLEEKQKTVPKAVESSDALAGPIANQNISPGSNARS